MTPFLQKSERERFSPTLSPHQEWRLHHGEVDVPVWFISFCNRVYDSAYEAGKKEERERIIKYLKEQDVPAYLIKNGHRENAFLDVRDLLVNRLTSLNT